MKTIQNIFFCIGMFKENTSPANAQYYPSQRSGVCYRVFIANHPGRMLSSWRGTPFLPTHIGSSRTVGRRATWAMDIQWTSSRTQPFGTVVKGDYTQPLLPASMSAMGIMRWSAAGKPTRVMMVLAKSQTEDRHAD